MTSGHMIVRMMCKKGWTLWNIKYSK